MRRIYSNINPKGNILVADEFSKTGQSLRTADQVIRSVYPTANVMSTPIYEECPIWYYKTYSLMGLEDPDHSIKGAESLFARRARNRSPETIDTFRKQLAFFSAKIAQNVDSHPVGRLLVTL